MANLIILEGLSRTGKSTIVDFLSHKYNFNTSWSGLTKNPEGIVDYSDFYYGMFIMQAEIFKSLKDTTFILDRNFLSELAYSDSFNRKTHINENFIDNLFKNNNISLIFLENTYDEYLIRVPKDKKIFTNTEYNLQIINFNKHYNYYKEKFTGQFEKIQSNIPLDNIIEIIENNTINKFIK